jgi:signal transduction histidine kinase
MAVTPQPDPAPLLSPADSFVGDSAMAAPGPPSKATDILAGGGEMGKLIRAMDWSQSPLGPIESWPQSLRTTVSLCLASNFPISIAWGPQRTQMYNDGYWPICGAKHPNSMGQDFKECWFSAWPAIGEAFERASAGETAFLVNERMFLDRYGYLEETFFTFSFSPIRDESGGVGGLFHPVTEMTQQTLAERRLKALRELADRTAEAKTVAEACDLIAQTLAAHELDLPFGLLYLLDSDGSRATLAGRAGLAAGTLACPDEVDLAIPPYPCWPLAEAARDREAVQVDGLEERFGPLACGSYPESPRTAFVLPISISGLRHPFGLLVAGVSSRRMLDEAYRTFFLMLRDTIVSALANAQAQQAIRVRDEFVSVAAHELRTPVTSISANLQLLQRQLERNHTLEPETLPARLQSLSTQTKRLNQFITGLLDVSRLETGKVTLAPELVDLAALVQVAATEAGRKSDRHPIQVSSSSSLLAAVDPLRIDQVLTNLLDNAIKYSPAGGPIEVTLTQPTPELVELTVTDHGIGILPEHRDQIFDRFYQAHADQKASGMGLGLFICRQIVELHGGEIRLESPPEGGSRFVVCLPISVRDSAQRGDTKPDQ